MSHLRLSVLLFPLAFVLSSAHAQTAPGQPGEYAYAVKVKAMGLSLPAIRFRQCVTRQDIDQGRAYINTDRQADCSTTALAWSGNAFTVSGKCTRPDRTMTGKGKASATGFDLVMEVEVEGDMPMTQQQIVSATRLGDCKR